MSIFRLSCSLMVVAICSWKSFVPPLLFVCCYTSRVLETTKVYLAHLNRQCLRFLFSLSIPIPLHQTLSWSQLSVYVCIHICVYVYVCIIVFTGKFTRWPYGPLCYPVRGKPPNHNPLLVGLNHTEFGIKSSSSLSGIFVTVSRFSTTYKPNTSALKCRTKITLPPHHGQLMQ